MIGPSGGRNWDSGVVGKGGRRGVVDHRGSGRGGVRGGGAEGRRRSRWGKSFSVQGDGPSRGCRPVGRSRKGRRVGGGGPCGWGMGAGHGRHGRGPSQRPSPGSSPPPVRPQGLPAPGSRNPNGCGPRALRPQGLGAAGGASASLEEGGGGRTDAILWPGREGRGQRAFED